MARRALHRGGQFRSRAAGTRGTVGRMRTLVGILQRHGLTLLLTAALVYLFVHSTLPALAERDRLRRARAAAELDTGALRDAVRERELWLEAVRDRDPFVTERIVGAQERSPELDGPRYVRRSPDEPVPAEAGTDGEPP